MAGRDHRAVSNEVNQFLDRRKGDYVKLLRMTQEELVRFKDRFQFRDAIYRIYSRADKQLGGEAFKTPEKITKKLMDWRAKRSSTKVHDIHDIIGITVVVYFETQRDLVAAGLLKRGALGKVRVFDREPKESDGYYAVHMKFASDEPGLDRLKGELQVKTLLHDGWAAKTHDIVYKPPIQLSDDVRKHTNILGETLQLVEKQSEIIRGLIEREIERENRRRRAAQATLMVRMTVRDSRDFDSRAATLARAIHKDLDHLRTSTESDRRFKHHFRNWKKFLKKHGAGRSACRLITFLASIREAQDLTNTAFDTIEEWIAESKEGGSKQNALIFRSVARYILGSFDAAVTDGRAALRYSTRHKLDTTLAKCNLGYYLAEHYFHNRHRLALESQKEIQRELAGLMRQLRSLGCQKDPNYADTLGAIAIAIGENQDDVRAGLDLCRHAWKQTKPRHRDYSRREAYFLLHEQRALQRLLELSARHQPSAAREP